MEGSERLHVISSAYKKPEREKFLAYFEKPYLDTLPIAFYYRSNHQISIDRYEDLYKFKGIGVLKGASYFERFDKDTQLSKYEVTSQDQLFPMTHHGRIDVMAGYVPTENYRLFVEGYQGKISKSNYEYRGGDPVYMAMSKKSRWAKRFDEFNRINTELMKNGFIGKIVERYYSTTRP